MKKPVGAVGQVGNSAMCGVKCASLGKDCGMFNYNKNTKLCTTAKVTELLDTSDIPVFITRL